MSYSGIGLIFFSQVVTHSATFDFWPATRHALRATPHGERPLSVHQYEEKTGKAAKDRQIEIWKEQGVDVAALQNGTVGLQKKRGYNDQLYTSCYVYPRMLIFPYKESYEWEFLNSSIQHAAFTVPHKVIAVHDDARTTKYQLNIASID